MPDPRIRPITEADIDAVVVMVHELAKYERLPEECHLTAEMLRRALFGDPQDGHGHAPAGPALFGHVAVVDPAGPQDRQPPVGYALHFLNYSTWEGVHGIYLEDLYVRPEHRGSGLGRALLVNLAEIAAARGYARVEWSVLDWNTPSIEFYRSLGAVPMDGWSTFRLSGPALGRTATGTR